MLVVGRWMFLVAPLRLCVNPPPFPLPWMFDVGCWGLDVLVPSSAPSREPSSSCNPNLYSEPQRRPEAPPRVSHDCPVTLPCVPLSFPELLPPAAFCMPPARTTHTSPRGDQPYGREANCTICDPVHGLAPVSGVNHAMGEPLSSSSSTATAST
jgi:hypothetical protein